ncbi:MAG: hypothetical protein JO345_34435 [Streptosporangiaceae bacterium]|nr:hypothetical protein [Streptosporangiaceae bacterium]
MSKLNPADGVRLQRTQLGNVALIVPLVYLDQQTPDATELALILGRADALELAAMLRDFAEGGQP